jgi:hypothetical protein
MTGRSRLIHFIFRNAEREVVNPTRKQAAPSVRPGSKLLQKRSALVFRTPRQEPR